ncbi:MAG: ATP-binding protein [Oscillospiraceae bacterium]|nr:ATP-binding protein [Oscillospiraceae bacterium]
MEKLNLNMYGQLAQSFDPAEHERLKIDSYNKTAGNLTGYDCPKCLNRGRYAIPKESGGMSIVDCDCMKIRRCVQKMEASGLREVIKSYTFDAFQDNEPWQTAIKRGAADYANKVDGWLLFCGQSGSGKTHLCTAVCRQLLLAGKEVRYMPWRQDVRELKAMESNSQVEALKKLQTAPILFIDDLFKTGRTADGSFNPTAADVNLAYDLINYRYLKRLTTIISTERSPAELVDIDEASGGRIVEMAQGHTYCIEKKQGRNYRLRGVVTV